MKKNNIKDAVRQTGVESAEDLKVTKDLEIQEAIEGLKAAETMMADAVENLEEAEYLDDLGDLEDAEYLEHLEKLLKELENLDEEDDEDDGEDDEEWGELKDWVVAEDTEDWEELKGLNEIEDPEELARRKAALDARLDKMFDEDMRNTFTMIAEAEYESRPQKFPKVQFSEDFERKMNELLYEEPEPEKKTSGLSSLFSLFRPLRSRRAIVAVAALMLLFAGMTAGGANPIIVWLHDSWMEQHGDYVEIEIREDATELSKRTFQKYELAELPEGYTLRDKEFDKEIGMYYITYVDEGGNTVIFRQGKKENKNLGNITANRKDIEEIKVNGLEGYYVKDSDAENLVLSDGEYMLVFAGNLSKEQFIELAEGLQVIERE